MRYKHCTTCGQTPCVMPAHERNTELDPETFTQMTCKHGCYADRKDLSVDEIFERCDTYCAGRWNATEGTPKLHVCHETAKDNDPVKSPSHYIGSDGLEVKEVIRQFDLSWAIGSCAKYVLRAGKKGDVIEDLRKAIECINIEIENRSR